MKPKSMTFSYSLDTTADNFYEVGIHYSDTDGVDIDMLASDDELEGLIEDIMCDFMDEYYAQKDNLLEEEYEEEYDEEESDEEVEEYIADLEAMIEDLTYENNSLKTDLKILQRRADDAVNESIKQRESFVRNLQNWLDYLQ